MLPKESPESDDEALEDETSGGDRDEDAPRIIIPGEGPGDLETLRRERDEYLETARRARADYMNLQRRMQTHYDEANQPVLYSLDYLRNDVFTFRIRRTI